MKPSLFRTALDAPVNIFPSASRNTNIQEASCSPLSRRNLRRDSPYKTELRQFCSSLPFSLFPVADFGKVVRGRNFNVTGIQCPVPRPASTASSFEPASFLSFVSSRSHPLVSLCEWTKKIKKIRMIIVTRKFENSSKLQRYYMRTYNKCNTINDVQNNIKYVNYASSSRSNNRKSFNFRNFKQHIFENIDI